MELSKKTKYILFILLIILNLILRYSVIPHELTNDSFEMHIIANSLSEFGEARWWTHPLSVVGMYPNSYASATSFLMSGISQCTGLEIEKVTFVLGLILGLFSIFVSYILAGKIYNDDFFKFVVAFGFSVSPGILAFTTWALHARSPFVLLVPLFVYALLQTKKYSLRFGLITLFLALLLLVTHHLVFYLIPIFVAWFLVTLVYILKEHINVIKKVIKKSEHLMPLFIILAFCLMFAYAFMTHKFMMGGSRWDYQIYKEHLRYTGMFSFLAIGGFAYLVFKPEKHYGEWSLLTILMFLTIFIQQQMYMKWLIIIFAILLAGIGLTNIKRLGEKRIKHATSILVIFLLLTVCFSGYFQFLHSYAKPFACEKYVEDSTYTTALWLKENLNGTAICNHKYIGWMICAISGCPFLTGSYSYDQAYGLVDVSEFELITLPSSSEEYWMDSPYKIVGGSDSDAYWHRVMTSKYDSSTGTELLSKFNLTHMIENTRTDGFWTSHHGSRSSEFLHSLYGENSVTKIYNNGNINIWPLGGGT
jgi:hypothetical protein